MEHYKQFERLIEQWQSSSHNRYEDLLACIRAFFTEAKPYDHLQYGDMVLTQLTEAVHPIDQSIPNAAEYQIQIQMLIDSQRNWKQSCIPNALTEFMNTYHNYSEWESFYDTADILFLICQVAAYGNIHQRSLLIDPNTTGLLMAIYNSMKSCAPADSIAHKRILFVCTTVKTCLEIVNSAFINELQDYYFAISAHLIRGTPFHENQSPDDMAKCIQYAYQNHLLKNDKELKAKYERLLLQIPQNNLILRHIVLYIWERFNLVEEEETRLLATAMSLHPRLGHRSSLASLDKEHIRMIASHMSHREEDTDQL